MKKISFRDVENLSAYLDGQTSQAERTRLETRLKSEPELAGILEDLREARQILRRTPKRRAPRNFTLTPRMAGLKPPIPRIVPALSWASAVAMLVFAGILGPNLLGRFSFGAASPMMSAAYGGGVGGGPPAAEGPYPETPVSDSSMELTPTPELMMMTLPEATAAPESRMIQPEETAAKASPDFNTWLILLPGVAAVLVGAALVLRWNSIRQFRQKSNIK